MCSSCDYDEEAAVLVQIECDDGKGDQVTFRLCVDCVGDLEEALGRAP